MEEPVYKELFERTVLASDVDYKIAAVREAHSEEFGWVMGEIKVQPTNDPNYVLLQIPLAKYERKEKSFQNRM